MPSYQLQITPFCGPLAMFAQSMTRIHLNQVFRVFAVACWAVCSPLLWVSSAYSQGTNRAAEFHSGPGYVLLSNGEVIAGDIQAFDRDIEIKIDDTASVRSNYDRVSYIGKSIDELYLFQVNRITEWGYGDHLKIGRWCAQQKLFERAMPHYEYLKSEIPDAPEFKRFQAELKEAMLHDQGVQTALTAAGIPIEQKGDSATTEQPVQAPPAAQTNKSMQAVRVDTNLQEVFRRDIHPVLISSCARTACHGTFSTNRLTLLDMSRVRAKDTVAQNLTAFTSYLNETKGDADSNPESHPIYQKAVGRHGNLMQSPLDVNDPKHQRFMEQLRVWVARTNSQSDQSSSELAAESQVNPLAPKRPFGSMPMMPPTPDLGGKARAFVDKQGLHAQAKAASAADSTSQILNPKEMGRELSGIAAAIAKLEEIERSRTQQKDPFDPAEFNAQFANSANPANATTKK